jgi:hypothetical protein
MDRPAGRLATSLLCTSFVLGSWGEIVCQDGITTGYADVAALRSDLLTKERVNVFTLCPDTAFDLINEPLEISRSVQLKCGDKGLLLESCIFEAGQNQVIMEGDSLEIKFQGLTFQRSEHASVSILTTNSVVTFSDCLWQYHSGDAVVIVGDSSVPIKNATGSRASSIKSDLTKIGNAEEALRNSTDTTSSVLDHIDGAEASNNAESVMMANGTGIADDILLHSPKATSETTIDPLGAPGGVVEGPKNSEGLHSRLSPSRIRHHGDRQLSSTTTSVSFKNCTFSVSLIDVIDFGHPFSHAHMLCRKTSQSNHL